MKKSLRQQVYRKYNGRCAYCGKKLGYKDMQVDHIIPKARAHFLKTEQGRKDIGGINIFNVNQLENLNPSCRRCNYYKRCNSLERFRQLMKDLDYNVETLCFLNKLAIDYGIIKITPFNGVFYFETNPEIEE